MEKRKNAINYSRHLDENLMKAHVKYLTNDVRMCVPDVSSQFALGASSEIAVGAFDIEMAIQMSLEMET